MQSRPSIQEAELIKTPVDQLPLSDSFCLRCKLLGFSNLGDILTTPPGILVEKKNFSYEWLAELSQFMIENNMLHLLQPIPGNTAG